MVQDLATPTRNRTGFNEFSDCNHFAHDIMSFAFAEALLAELAAKDEELVRVKAELQETLDFTDQLVAELNQLKGAQPEENEAGSTY